ncbi:MAG: VCBS repeat-containing protein [Bifidobacteriaceae bacterium]|jgi:hypothetical protein|nr:VCBS repeat-containing protein [Bifidobacteriaceae bacterium]
MTRTRTEHHPSRVVAAFSAAALVAAGAITLVAASSAARADLPLTDCGQVDFTLSPDMNGDGRGEIILVSASAHKGLEIIPVTAAGEPGIGSTVATDHDFSASKVYGPGDWNGDGKADIVEVDQAGYMWLWPGDGNNGLGSRVEIGHGWKPFRIIPAGDLTQDGANDLLAIDKQGRLWLYYGSGRGGFKGTPRQVGQGWVGLELYAAGDLNGDRKNDILAILPDGTLWAYQGRGNGTFGVPKQVGRGWGTFKLAAGADLNGDGRADIVGQDTVRTKDIYHSEDYLYYYRGNGGGSFQAPKIIMQRIGYYPHCEVFMGPAWDNISISPTASPGRYPWGN